MLVYNEKWNLSEETLVRRIREKTGMDLPGEPYARNR